MHYIILPLEGMKEKIETPLANLSEFMRQFNITILLIITGNIIELDISIRGDIKAY